MRFRGPIRHPVPIVRPSVSLAGRRASRIAGVAFALTLEGTLTAAVPPGTAPQLPQQGGSNPLAGKRLYVDPNSTAKREAETLRRSRPQDAVLLSRIADQPVARWLGGWVGDIGREVDAAVSTITGSGSLPVFVAYNIPGRDCGQYSAGGANGGDAYRRWIGSFASGLRGRPALVVLEPDALAGIDCLNASGQQQRLALLREAVVVLKAQHAEVYIDAGNARWKSADIMAARLRDAGIAQADGFSLNVSNYIDNAANIAFGEKLSRLLGGKHFIIDTSRNGLGPTSDHQWCNPADRGAGLPAQGFGFGLVDAHVWAQNPGNSDGSCNGAPPAGTFSVPLACTLAHNATF